MTDIDEKRIAEIRARVEKATEGEWSFDGPPSNLIVWAGDELRICFMTSDGPNVGNVSFIAHARQDIPDLIAALEASMSKVKFQSAALVECRELNARLMGDDESTPRYTTKRLRLEIATATSAIEAALAECQAENEPQLVCSGCGSNMTGEEIKEGGFLGCCPEGS